MSSSERSIPHLRDIFGLNGSNGYTMHSSNNISHYHNNNHNNNHYQNGNSMIVSNSYTNNNNNHNPHHTSDINEHTSYGTYDNQNHNQQNMIDTNMMNNNKKNNSSKKKRDNSKTLTSGDVKTLERHLSMKKTIRKKIMRDLQQAFVEDPNEFRIENINQDQLKAEIRAEAFRFGATNSGDNQKQSRKSDNFLDMLRGEKNNTTTTTTTTTQQQQQTQQPYQQYNSTTSSTTNNISNNYNDYTNGSNREYDYDSQPTQQQQTTEKQSFWRRFTMKNKTKR